jgi:hypothetical protein
MTCAGCNTEIADKALICYRCGRPTVTPRVTPPSEGSIFTRPAPSRWPLVLGVLGAVVVAVAAWFLLR